MSVWLPRIFRKGKTNFTFFHLIDECFVQIPGAYSIIMSLFKMLKDVLIMTTKIMPVTDLRRQASQIIREIQTEGDVVYITQHGRPAVVLVDYDQYEAMRAELEELGRKSSLPYKTGAQEANYTTPSRLLSALADMAEDLGVEDLAEHHDHYLNGVDKE
jgi:prevent-host-death family protein